MATIKRNGEEELSNKNFKMIRRNGEIRKSVMNSYIEKIGGKEKMMKGVVIYNAVNVVRGYEERDLSRIQLQEVTYVPFILTNDNGEALWILVEIDKRKKKVITYDPDRSYKDTIKLVTAYTELDKSDEGWVYVNDTSVSTHDRNTDSGVFISAWIESIVLKGKIENCITSSMVYVYREKMYKTLMIKDAKEVKNLREAEENLREVLNYRKEILDSEEFRGANAIPISILEKQTSDLRNITKIEEDELNGRYLVSTIALKKGRILGFYNGVMQRGEGKDEDNEYNLKLEHLDDRGGAYIDGTPGIDTDSYRLSLINGDYTETMTMHNCGIDEFGRITMTKNVSRGKNF